MALGIGSHASAHAESAGSVTTSAITITSGSLVVIGTLNFDVNTNPNDDITPTDSGGVNVYTLIGKSSIVSNRYSGLWYCANVTGGSLTFNYSLTVGSDFPRIFVVEITGADTTTPLDVSNFASSNSATSVTTTGITTALANEILVAIGGDGNATDAQTFANGGCATSTGSWTIVETQDATGNGLSGSLAYAIVSSTGTYCVTLGITGSASQVLGGMATFKAAAGAPKSLIVPHRQPRVFPRRRWI